MALRGRSNLTKEQFFFVTTTVVNFNDIFSKDIYCDLLIKNINHYKNRYQFNIIAYVIMPSHFHWILQVNPKFGTVSDIMRDIKKYSAWDIMEAIEQYDPNLSDIFAQEGTNYPKHKRKFWMKRFDDEVIRNEKMFWVKLLYIHNNPVEAGIVNKAEDYKYSSAKNYIFGDNSILQVDTSLAGVQMK
jgi:REP element-mobilizing transposase RayT